MAPIPKSLYLQIDELFPEYNAGYSLLVMTMKEHGFKSITVSSGTSDKAELLNYAAYVIHNNLTNDWTYYFNSWKIYFDTISSIKTGASRFDEVMRNLLPKEDNKTINKYFNFSDITVKKVTPNLSNIPKSILPFANSLASRDEKLRLGELFAEFKFKRLLFDKMEIQCYATKLAEFLAYFIYSKKLGEWNNFYSNYKGSLNFLVDEIDLYLKEHIPEPAESDSNDAFFTVKPLVEIPKTNELFNESSKSSNLNDEIKKLEGLWNEVKKLGIDDKELDDMIGDILMKARLTQLLQDAMK